MDIMAFLFINALSHDVNLSNWFIDTDQAVVLLWFSVARFWRQSLGDVSPYVCS